MSTRVNPTHNYLITFMTIAKDFASKASVAFVALAMIFTMSVPASNAQQSAEDLQKMINDLLAQIATLQGQAGQGSATASGYTWTRDLKTGATGADVMELQKFLNADADTRVAATGAGSAGMETQTFGPATAAAVSKFQMKYRADILTPAGLVNPTGFFGPSTRAKANALNTVTTTPDEEEEEGSTDEEEEEEESEELSGEGTLDTFEIDDATDTDVQEGAEDAEIAELTLEATDGDIEIDRIDFTIETDGDNTENDPWEVFEEITLWVDGEEVASFDASDEDNYLDEDDGTFRFTNVGLVLMEDEEVEVTVAATVVGSVDDAGVSDEADWTVEVNEFRYFDADGVSEDDDSTGDIDTAVSFEIVEEGEGEELKFSNASSNPDATDIVVDTDDSTDGVTILEYTIEAEEGDIELNTLFVKVDTSATSSSVIDDIALEIDGQSFDAENSASTTGNTTTFEFDIDGDIAIDADEEVTVAVVVDLKSQESSTNVDRYTNGTTIEANVTSVERDLTDAEGADDIDTFSGTASGESHTLVAEGIVVPVDSVETSTDTSGDNDQTGQFTIEFEVTAVEGDFYILEDATEGTTATSGVEFTVDGPSGFAATSSGVLSSTADEDTSGVFTVREGETETFTLTVTVDTDTTGQHRVQLGNVNYTANANGTTATEAYTPTPTQDFDTAYININAN